MKFQKKIMIFVVLNLKLYQMTHIPIFVSALKADIVDFRKPQGKRYDLHNLLTIMILCIAANGEDFEAMSLFCRQKSDFLIANGLLDGKNYPSHDIFRWILQKIDKKSFGKFLVAWLDSTEPLEATVEDNTLRSIHIDGKVLRATRTTEHTRTGLVVLNAYCSQSRIVIGAELLDKKTSEKTAIPVLIDELYLEHSIVTIDAIGTMRSIAAQLRDKKAHYLLPLKKNNKLFFQEVDDFFRVFGDSVFISDPITTSEQQAGRTEVRRCTVLTDFRHLPDAEEWKDLQTIVKMERTRTQNGKTTTETVYYLTSLGHDATMLMDAIRRHWTVENGLHWHLDVSFQEDKHRLADKNAALCFALLRRFVLSLLKRQESKQSIKARRLAAAWNDETLAQILQSI
jgi:predicted transposase YbfD/YdcC